MVHSLQIEHVKIAVNTRLLIPNKLEGIGRFTHESLQRLVQSHPEHEFLFIFDREFDDQFIYGSNVTPTVVYPSARHPFLYYLWFEWRIPPVLRKNKVDLFLSPDGYLALNSEKKQLPVIHDINFEHYPKHIPVVSRKHYQHYFPKYAQKAKRIATVSEFSKEDIIGQYHIDPNKIDVVHNGVSEVFHPVSEDEKKETKERYTNGADYFVYIGAIQPRKNMTNMFKAFDAFKKANNNKTQLLIVGEKRWWTAPIKEAFESMEHKSEVTFTQRLSNEELNSVLASALCLIYVSYFEGFGLPILEAFQCQTPVITSNVTSMPEVAGEAAIFVSPFDIESIKEGMEKVSKNPSLRQKLIEKGIAQKENYSWDKTADLLWQSVEKCFD